jgi:hypothetical protein
MTFRAVQDVGGCDRLVDGAFDPGSGRVALFPLVGGVFGSGLLYRLVDVAGRSINCLPVRVDRVHCGRTGHD